jgi:hypothetical protein
MASLEQVQQEIQTLSQEALDLVAQFVHLLKKSRSTDPEQRLVEQPEPGSSAAILNFLETHPLTPEQQRPAAEIDQHIREERAAWD